MTLLTMLTAYTAGAVLSAGVLAVNLPLLVLGILLTSLSASFAIHTTLGGTNA